MKTSFRNIRLDIDKLIKQKNSEDYNPDEDRRPKKDKTREHIIYSALVVFSDIGYDAANIRDIVRESGLSPGTFYNYFEDKAPIFILILDYLLLNIRQEIRIARIQAKTADDFVYDTYYSFLHYFDRNPIILNFISKNLFPIRSAIYEGNQMTGIYFELEKDLKGMIKEGLFPATSNTRYLAWTMVGTAVEILTQMTIKKKINIQDCCDYMVKLFVGGAKNAV